MTKYIQTDIGSGFNRNKIDSENTKIESAINDQLDRKGATPNAMEADLDMGNKRILNLKDAVALQEPVTLQQLNDAGVTVPTGPFASTLINYTSPEVGGVQRTLASVLNETKSIMDFNPNADGISDDSATINAAIATLSAGATAPILLEFPEGTYACNSIVMKPYVGIKCTGGSFLFNGIAGESIFISLITEVPFYAHLIDIAADCGVGGLIDFFSYHSSYVSLPAIKSSSTTSTLISIQANSEGSLGPTGSQNTAGVFIDGLNHNGTCGTGLYLRGSTTGATATLHYLTLCEFRNLVFQNCAVRGWDLTERVDNNTFSGIHRCQLSANNGIGIEFGRLASTVDVYSNRFYTAAIDSFGNHTGREQVKFNISRGNSIENFHADDGNVVAPYLPTTFNIDHANVRSFYVRQHGTGGNGKDRILSKGIEEVGSFRVTTNSGQVITASPVDIVFQTKGAVTEWDYGANDGESFTLASGRFTAPVKGVYHFEFNATAVPTVSGDHFWVMLDLRSSSDVSFGQVKKLFTANGTGPQQLSWSGHYRLQEGQRAYIVVERRAGSTGSLTLSASDASLCHFTGQKVNG